MNPAVETALWALFAFQCKHFLCDFVWQTQRQVQTKGIYGHLGGIEHAGLHALTSLPAILILTRAPAAIAAVVIVEFIVHYHVDWTKARIDRVKALSVQDSVYWVYFGLDQLVHQLTYLGIVAVLISLK
jgi:hypothetical protein